MPVRVSLFYMAIYAMDTAFGHICHVLVARRSFETTRKLKVRKMLCNRRKTIALQQFNSLYIHYLEFHVNDLRFYSYTLLMKKMLVVLNNKIERK